VTVSINGKRHAVSLELARMVTVIATTPSSGENLEPAAARV
jgi:hypothetical protein